MRFVQRRHRAIYPSYQALSDAGHVARYGTLAQFQRMFTPDVVRDVLIGRHLDAISRYVDTFMANQGPASAGS
jgi:hypothetical protein